VVSLGLELDVSEVSHGGNELEEIGDLGLGKANDLHGALDRLEVVRIVDGLDLGGVSLLEVEVIIRAALEEAGVLEDLVEDVKVPLALCLVDDTGLLQEVIGDVSTDRVATVVELDVHVLALK